MQTLSCVKFNQILALVLLEPWSSCVVVCRLCLVYNLTKFRLQFYTGSLEQLCCSMQTLSCVKFDQIQALVLLEPWCSCVVVCRLCLVYNLAKFWLQFRWILRVAVLQYVDFVLCKIWPNFGSSSTGSLEQQCCSMQALSCVKFDQILALVLLEPWCSCVVVCRLCLV